MTDVSYLIIKGQKTKFACDCGCKLFAVLENNQFRCQNCGDIYEAEVES